MLIDPKWSRLVAAYTGAALVKVILFVSAFMGGNYLDEKLGTPPLFVLLFIFIAMGIGTWYIIVLSKRKL